MNLMKYYDDMGNDMTTYVRGLEEQIEALKKAQTETVPEKVVTPVKVLKPFVPKKKKYSNINP